MGSPLSPILCDIYLHYFEVKLFERLDFGMWWRYVDDTFVLVDNAVDTTHILQTVNSIDPHIQFTIELESNNQIPFLDVLVSKGNGSFSTSVFRKSFSVSAPPHARSNHPFSQKTAAFYTYVYRALHLCSDEHSLASEISYLKSLASGRGFCPSLIDKALRKFSSRSRPQSSTLQPLKKEFSVDNLVVLPFYPRVSNKFARILSRFDFNVVFRPTNKISFPSVKAPIPKLRNWGIYHVPCSCGLGYIGQTRRALKFRISEHSRCVLQQDLAKSAIARHSWNSNHSFDFQNVGLIAQTRFVSELDFLEGLHIYKNAHNLINDQNSGPHLHPAWTVLVNSNNM